MKSSEPEDVEFERTYRAFFALQVFMWRLHGYSVQIFHDEVRLTEGPSK